VNTRLGYVEDGAVITDTKKIWCVLRCAFAVPEIRCEARALAHIALPLCCAARP
jgi:hypothetical protein